MNYYGIKVALLCLLSCTAVTTFCMEQKVDQAEKNQAEEKNSTVTNEQLLAFVHTMGTRLGEFTTDTAKAMQTLMAKIETTEKKMKEFQEKQAKMALVKSPGASNQGYPSPDCALCRLGLGAPVPPFGTTRYLAPSPAGVFSASGAFRTDQAAMPAPLHGAMQATPVMQHQNGAGQAVPTQSMTTQAVFAQPRFITITPAESNPEWVTKMQEKIDQILKLSEKRTPEEVVILAQKCFEDAQKQNGYIKEKYLLAATALFKRVASSDNPAVKRKAFLFYARQSKKVDEKMKQYELALCLSSTKEEEVDVLMQLVKLYARRVADSKKLHDACIRLVADDTHNGALALGNYYLGVIYQLGKAVSPDADKAILHYKAVLTSKGKESSELRTAARKALARLEATPNKTEIDEVLEAR